MLLWLLLQMVKIIHSPIGSSQMIKRTRKPRLKKLDYFFACFLVWVAVTLSNILILVLLVWI